MVRVQSDVGGPLDCRCQVGGDDGDVGRGGRSVGGSSGVRFRVENAERMGGQSVRNGVPPGRRPVAGGVRVPGRVMRIPITHDESVFL